jgi:hypothetical protein
LAQPDWSFTQYETEMLKRAWTRAKVHLRLELAIVGGGVAATALGESYLKGSVDASTLWIAIACGMGGVLATALYFAIPEPLRAHNELTAQVAELTEGIPFAALLRVRRDAIDRVHPLDNQEAALDAANQQLVQEQLNVISLLERPDNPWKFAPEGWKEPMHPLVRWAALAHVLHLRYPGQVSPVESLYEPAGNDMGRIPPRFFPMVKELTAMCVMLIVREIEFPASAHNDEPPDAFLGRCAAFTPPSVGRSC